MQDLIQVCETLLQYQFNKILKIRKQDFFYKHLKFKFDNIYQIENVQTILQLNIYKMFNKD